MSVQIKTSSLKIKDNNGNYKDGIQAIMTQPTKEQIEEAVNEVIDDVKEDISKVETIDKDFARRIRNLEAVNEGKTFVFVEDSEKAYQKDVEAGAVQSEVKVIGGKSVAYNQMVVPPTLDSYTSPEIISIDNGVIKVQITTTGAISQFYSKANIINRKAYHKYYIRGDVKSEHWASSGYTGFFTYGGMWTGGDNYLAKNISDWQRLDCISQTSTGGEGAFAFRKYAEDTNSDYYAKNMLCIDLTQMFGADNEPTIEQCRQIFTSDYYPYNEGELVSASSEKVVSRGKNLFDEVLEVGGIAWATGLDVTNNETLRSKNFTEIRGSKIYFECNYIANVFFYNASKEKISAVYKSATTKVFDVPSDAKYVRFNLDKTYGTSYKNDIAINMGTSGTYTPYRKPIELETNYGTLRSAGSVYDYIDFERQKLVRRVGVVDMGTLNWVDWSGSSEAKIYLASVPNMAIESEVIKRIDGIVCAKYPTDTTLPINENSTDKTCKRSSGVLYVRDTSYTDASAFKTAMSGVMLYYELATPTEEDIEVTEKYLEVEDGGTLTFVSDQDENGFKIPVPNTELNMVKVV